MTKPELIELKLIPVSYYRVETSDGVYIGDFQRKETWNGFTSFSAQSGRDVFVTVDGGLMFFDDFCDMFFGKSERSEKQVTVIKASASVIEKITKSRGKESC